MTSHVTVFIWGALTAACGVISLLFLRFWALSRDRLLLYFAAAFAALALNWLLLGLTEPGDETRHFAYFIRLSGFLLLIVGVVDKNRRGARAA